MPASTLTHLAALLFGLMICLAPALADPPPPPPSASSLVGDAVTNTVTSAETTVSALVSDPSGTPSAGDTAWVKTADGYNFLVKSAGETFYNSDVPPIAFEVQSISGTTVTVESSANPGVFTDFESALTDSDYDLSFNSSGSPGSLEPPVDVSGSSGVKQIVYGRDGSNGRAGALFVPPASGGDGQDGPAQTKSLGSDVNAASNIGWEIGSVGGDGGKGGNSYASFWSGRSGGDGGKGGRVAATQTPGSTIQTSGNDNHGIFAYSRSGKAGDGGSGYAAPGGGTGGLSADGGTVTVNARGEVFTSGTNAHGIYALSVSNNGGNGGDQWGLVGSAGDGGFGGSGGRVTVNASGTILTQGNFSHGILAQSIGGSGGSAGSAGNLLLSLLGANDNGGNGSTVTVANSGAIQTEGDFSRGIVAQSIGGGGGTGGGGGGLVALALGGVGSNGGSGGAVNVTNQGAGTIRTRGAWSDGILAQSIGGSGAQGSNAGGLIAVGGNGSNGGGGSPVSVQNFGLIETEGTRARGVVAQSIGGGGGDGGNTGGMVAVGGSGSGGGSGSTVTVLNDGVIRTNGADSYGILAQSIGGGGGNGGSSGSVGAFVGVAIGGKGGAGGDGGNANVTLSDTDASQPSIIRTQGERATGVFVQSVGGGGGNGGGAVQVTAGAFGAASVALGGSAGDGGAGGTVILTGSGAATVQTDNSDATGVLLQSVGGGGGNGGYAVSVALAGGPVSGSLSVGVGGSGGDGGAGGEVRVGTLNGSGQLVSAGFSGNVVTNGARSTGLNFQSVGGGGGNGGLAVSAAGGGSVYFSGALSVGVGGTGATGGVGGRVRVYTDSSISTAGDSASAIIAQSVGGGGGNGGGSISAGVTASGGGAATINVGVGGSAGTGGRGGDVDLITGASAGQSITTQGQFSTGVIAQSIGGGGGNGGYSVAAGGAFSGTAAGSVQVGLGGSAGGGGQGGTVTARIDTNVTTRGEDATGVLVQSVGGGGGNGGFSVAAGAAGAGTASGAVTVGLGGKGGAGGVGGNVTATVNGNVRTEQDRSSAVVVQSVGGGGGNGGFSVSGNIAGAGTGSGSVAVGLGGSGGIGSNAGRVQATGNGAISTSGFASSGFVAQSIGGGGGNGGFNVSAAFTGAGTGAGALSVGLGGSGAGGGDGGEVVANTTNRVVTGGDASVGILAQSVGGGGGNGGFNVSPTFAAAGTGAGTIGIGIGGSGAGGGDGGTVSLDVSDTRSVSDIAAAPQTVLTSGKDSAGVIAQSIGGGGGNGGLNVTPTVAGAGTGSGTLAVGIGGRGAGGGDGGTVGSTVVADIETLGAGSTGLLVQSVGGGGGNGGLNVSAAIGVAGTGTGGAAVGIGGAAGTGGKGGVVTSTLTGDVQTGASTSPGVLVQSLGGGGGNGGINVSGAVTLSNNGSGGVGVGIGGFGGGGGNSSAATGTVTGTVMTAGVDSPGVTVQSLGGGGGNGGLNVSAAVSIGGTGAGAGAIGVGGFGGDGGTAGNVMGTFIGTATTQRDRSAGVTAQSLGGGGGNGATTVSAAVSLAPTFSGALGVGVGGFGGGGGAAGTVDHTVQGYVETAGAQAIGIMTQSLGGGGGNGGASITVPFSLSRSTSGAIGIGVGGFGGNGADAGETTTSRVNGGVLTLGDKSSAIVTQSLGGGGGTGGTNVTAAVNLTLNNGGALSLGLGGFGGGGGDGKAVSSTVRTTATHDTIATEGAESIGVLAQSVGGGGGAGGTNVSAAVSLTGRNGGAIGLGVGGFGGSGGDAGPVTLDVIGDVATAGNKSHGLYAQSLGGGGGVGGTNVSGTLSLTKPNSSNTILSASIGVGGFGGGGGDAGDVDLDYTGALVADPSVLDGTFGADGIVAQSIGGGGGDGGLNVSAGVSISSAPGTGVSDSTSSSYGLLVGVGGFGGTGGNAGGVTVDIGAGSTIDTHGTGRSGILAQSVGGGGGGGGLNVSGGIVSDTSLIVGVGGFGGNAGSAANVDVTARADITVTTDPAEIVDPTDSSFEAKLRDVLGDTIVDEVADLVDSKGLKGLFVDLGLFKDEAGADVAGSAGLQAQSIGGGGGDGGLNVSGGIALSKDGKIPSITFGVGGFGGAGNVAGNVDVDHEGQIDVSGNWKHGIFAQSIAGGGGNGGLNVSGQLNWNGSQTSDGATDLSIVAGLGGHGGAGADAGNVSVTSSGNIATEGYHARGVFAQSIGGGGGTGGINVSAVATKNSSPVGIGVGGFGSGGGDAGNVTVLRGTAASAAGLITTDGIGGHGIEASSIGGGGGDAGVNAVLGFTKVAGSQSDGGSASERKVPEHTGVDASVITNFNAVLDELEGNQPAPSGGGNSSVAALIAIGGAGGSAGNGGAVGITHFGDVVTLDSDSHGVFGQSIGGGGGNAAFNFGMIYQAGKAENSKGFGLAVGGGTGDGGTGGDVTLANTGIVSTSGDDSHGLFAQSVGGGGGNAGYDSVSTGAEGGTVDIKIGRTGGTGGAAGNVVASSDGIVVTGGARSHGLLAQSIGNGGGNSSATSITLGTPKSEDDKGSSFGLSVGLEGGQGGAAGTVDVTAAGTVVTAGEEAHGLFAQSVGGGGGTGGGASSSPGAGKSIALNIGGSGGIGGIGGAVTVGSAADIRTGSDRAIGILAQSIGGAGGTGGYAKSSTGALAILKNTVKGSEIGTTMSLNVGGTGGAGMASDTVDVANDGTIGTQGANAHGIFAQSVGGGGGKGGAVEHNIVSLRGSIGNQATISIGGDGGTGAVSDDVTVINAGTIETMGDSSTGVFAQSVGGGGGDAQALQNIVLGLQADNTSSNALLLGGSGGTGGAAGNVTVTNDTGAAILTEGRESHAVFAQSVGGGGGNGGTVISVARANSGDTSKQSRNLRLAIGGTGGDGGTGGAVDVTNDGAIQTTGAGAHGILAQSVGGGGGDGGMSVVGTVALKSGTSSDPSLGLSLGGAGGSGNAADAVTVENTGSIAVSGDKAYGVLAQSVGGGGGNGGLSVALSTADIAARASGKSWTQIAVGGAGGDGADAGDVAVNHTGTISVSGDDAYGIFAQSVGGGGGTAGVSVSAPGPMMLDYLFSTVLGARTGTGGTAGAVAVTSRGDIVMTGANSQAILTQSINGGGGTTDSFVDFTASAATPAALSSIAGGPPDVIGDITLGGEDADLMTGSTINASHQGNLRTDGRKSVASLTQSIGGGGGNGATSYRLDPDALVDLTLALGARNTDGAGGGDVTLDRNGDVMTTAAQSQAVSVQSIGGGGGRLVADLQTSGARATNATADLKLGADPSFLNPGGDLDLSLQGQTATMGDLSPGLVIQSIGAGGGQSYLTGMTTAEIAMGATDGSTGDGGAIVVSNTGEVITMGDRSDGIVVQSIGGGGGYVLTDLAPASVTVTANADNGGDGGDLALVQTGEVYTPGAGSVGILAQSLGGGGGVVDDKFRQSAGGTGAGGAVSLTGTGNVVAQGEGGIAVFLQSDGGTGADAITASLDGVIKGGSGDAAVAVQIDGGAANTLAFGADSFVYALNDLAMRGGAGDDAVTLAGQVTGNIDLDGGVNRFTNAASGQLVTLDTVDLGPSGLLTNAGTLQPGGEIMNPELGFGALRSDYTMVPLSFAQTTDLTGSLLMTPSSLFLVDASFRVSGAAGDGSDLINATGDGTIDGYVEPTLLSFERALPLTLIDPDGVATDAGADVRDTVVVDFSIAANTAIQLLAAPDFSLPGMSRNQSQVGDHINDILYGAGSASLGPLFAYIGNMSSEAQVVDTIDRLTTEGYAATRVVTLQAGLRFADRIGNCDGRRAGEIALPNGDCWWLAAGRTELTQDPFDGYRSLNSFGTQLFAGVKRKLDDPMWSFSMATGFEKTSMTSGSRFSSAGERFYLGAALERKAGPVTLGASLSTSFGDFDSTRIVGIFDTLPDGSPIALDRGAASQQVNQTNLRLSAAYLHVPNQGRFYAKPSVDFDASYIRSKTAREVGLGDYGMTVGSTGEWVLSVSPSVEIGSSFVDARGTKTNPYLRGGLTIYNKDTLKIDSAFRGAPGSAGQFQNSSKFDQVVGRLNAGLVIESEDARTRFEFGYAGAYGENTVNHGANASFSLRF